LVGIAQSTVRIVHQFGNLGQADETEVQEAEAEEQRMEIAAGVAQHRLWRQWMILISVLGVPSLPDGSVAGRIDTDLPSLDERQLLTSLLAASPAVQTAQAGVERAEAALRRARRETISDLTFKGGLQQNYEPLNLGAGRAMSVSKASQKFAYIFIFGTAIRATLQQLALTSRLHRMKYNVSTSYFASAPLCLPKSIAARV
jgi:outer membrane protein TolC